MNWFSGKLVIETLSGKLVEFHGVSSEQAQIKVNEYRNNFRSSLYYPHPISMEPT